MNKLQTCLLFFIALPVIVLIGIPLFLLVFGVSFGFISSLISGIREVLLPLGCIFAAVTIIGIISYIIASRENKKREREMEEKREREMEEREKEKEMERDIARFEALSTPEEYVAYYEEKLQEQRQDLQRAKERREENLQSAAAKIAARGMQVGRDPHIRYLYEQILDTKKTIKRYKNMIDLPQGSHEI